MEDRTFGSSSTRRTVGPPVNPCDLIGVFARPDLGVLRARAGVGLDRATGVASRGAVVDVPWVRRARSNSGHGARRLPWGGSHSCGAEYGLSFEALVGG